MSSDYYQLKKKFVAYVNAKFDEMEFDEKYSKKALIKEIYVKFAMKPEKIEKELNIMIDDVEFFEEDGFIIRKQVTRTPPSSEELRRAILKLGLNNAGAAPPLERHDF